LYLQLFDEDDDVDDLIGDIELQLGEYLNVEDPDVNGTWMALNNYKKKGELRIFIQFQKRELGPSAIRKLNNSLQRILTAPKWGLVEMMKPALMKLFLDMIKGGNQGNEDIRKGLHDKKSAQELEECTDGEELVWKTQQYCYNHPSRSRQYLALQGLIKDIVVLSYEQDQSCQTIADENQDAETGNMYYPTYGQVYRAFISDVLLQLEELPDDIEAMDGEGRMVEYATQKILDLTNIQQYYQESRLEWFFETKIGGLANVLAPKVFAKLLLQLWRTLMETSLNLLLPTLKTAGGAGIPHWDPIKKGPRPTNVKIQKKKKNKKACSAGCLGCRKRKKTPTRRSTSTSVVPPRASMGRCST
jgi:hypothetical protein